MTKHVNRRLMFISTFMVLTAAITLAENVQNQSASALTFKDRDGRQFIPRGFVVVQQDSTGLIDYTLQDYQRMVRCGANFQVIRISLGNFGGWPGTQPKKDFLQQADKLVALGRQVGLQTAFKMTVYFTPHFSWEKFWLNKNNEQDAVLKGWKVIWNRYKDEPSVIAYDLLNEPTRGSVKEPFDSMIRKRLAPFYRRLIDEMHAISPDKWAMYQPMVIKPGEPRGPSKLPFTEMNVDIGRDHLIYAPHGYFPDPKQHEKAIKLHMRDAARSKALLMLGEWGRHTDKEMDTNLELQNKHAKLYTDVAALYDAHAVGMIKAWFLGTRKWLKGKHFKSEFTWSVFCDKNAVGTVERKYIMDVVARPAPLTLAGQVESYHYDPVNRTFRMTFSADRKLENSEIFIGQNRHYPDGFTLVFNDDLQLGYDPFNPQNWVELSKVTPTDKQAFTFDVNTQQLKIKCWPGDQEKCTLKILPGISKLSDRWP